MFLTNILSYRLLTSIDFNPFHLGLDFISSVLSVAILWRSAYASAKSYQFFPQSRPFKVSSPNKNWFTPDLSEQLKSPQKIKQPE